MSTKVVFLDIDGVLVTKRLLKQRVDGRKVAEPDCVSALNHLTQVAGAEIVISSSWRFCGQQEMQAILDLWGVDAPIVGMTPDLTRVEGGIYKAVPRGNEIQQYLDEHLEIKYFVILDDECDMAHLERYMVKTKFDCGLTIGDVERAIEILSESLTVRQNER